MKYLVPKYRPGVQTQFCLVQNPSFGIFRDYHSLPPSCGVFGGRKGYFLEADQWGRVKLGLVWEEG